VHVDKLGRVGSCVGEHREGSPCFNGLELGPVPDQQHLGSSLSGASCESVECESAGERGLVDDDQLVLPQCCSPLAMLVEPLRRVLAGDAEFSGKHRSRGRARCEADDAPRAVLTGPRSAESPQRGGLAGAGWADEQIDHAARDGDRCDRLRLLWGEAPSLDGPGCDAVDKLDGDCGGRRRLGALEESILGGKQMLCGEDRGVLRPEGAGAVITDEHLRRRRELRWCEA
jgi:hypothetical protein